MSLLLTQPAAHHPYKLWKKPDKNKRLESPVKALEELKMSGNETTGNDAEFKAYIQGLMIFSTNFRNKEEKAAFYQFSSYRLSLTAILWASIFLSVSGIYFNIMSLLNAKSRTILLCNFGIIALVRVPSVLILWRFKKIQKEGKHVEFIKAFVPWMPVLENLLSVLTTGNIGMSLIARVLNGECFSLDQSHMFGCNSEYASRALPQEHLLILMLIPLVYSVVYKVVRWEYICISWVLVIVSVCISIGISGATQSIPCLLIYIPTSFIVLYENHRQNLILFFVTQEQRQLLERNKVLSENAQNELRHMIANVAHDLKTVS